MTDPIPLPELDDAKKLLDKYLSSRRTKSDEANAASTALSSLFVSLVESTLSAPVVDPPTSILSPPQEAAKNFLTDLLGDCNGLLDANEPARQVLADVLWYFGNMSPPPPPAQSTEPPPPKSSEDTAKGGDAMNDGEQDKKEDKKEDPPALSPAKIRWMNLQLLTDTVHSNYLVPPSVLSLTLPPSLLVESPVSTAGLRTILQGDLKQFRAKLMKQNTSRIFSQKKFGLCREAPVGWARCMQVLGAYGEDTEDATTEALVIEQIQSLISVYDLDPIRVQDLILDCLEISLAAKHDSRSAFAGTDKSNNISKFTSLLDAFHPGKNLVSILGFKLLYYARKDTQRLALLAAKRKAEAAAKDGAEDTAAKKIEVTAILRPRRSLLLLIAHLRLHCPDEIDFSALSPYLLPLNSTETLQSDLRKAHDECVQSYAKKVKKIGAVSLTSSGGGGEIKNVLPTFCSSGKGLAEWIFKWEEENGLLPPSLMLIECLLALGGVEEALSIMEKIGEDVNLVFMCPGIGSGIRRALHGLMGDIATFDFNSLAESSSGNSSTTIPGDFFCSLGTAADFEKINTLLSYLTPSGLGSDPVLFSKLCKLVKSTCNGPCPKIRFPAILTLLKRYLTPALSCIPTNPPLSLELWDVLSLLPYRTRYSIYDYWGGRGGGGKGTGREALPAKALAGMGMNRSEGKDLLMIEKEAEAAVQAKWILKRISKENIKEMGRNLARISHGNPIVVFGIILGQIESYDNLISMMVGSFKFLSPLGLDVMSHSMLCAAGGGATNSSQRSKLKNDGLNATQWLASLEQFIGTFYRKFPQVEIRGILSFVVCRLRDGHVLELGVLKSILAMMGSVKATADLNVSNEQLEGSAGGPILRSQTREFGVVNEVNKNSGRILRLRLQDPSIGLPLLVLVSQIRHKTLFEHPSSQIKLIGNLFDLCNTLLLQLVEFLGNNPESADEKNFITKFKDLIPDMCELVDPNTYGMDADVAFALGRPLIAAANDELFGSPGWKGGDGKTTTEQKDKMEDGEGDEDIDLQNWHFESEEINKTVRTFLPEDSFVAKVLSKSLYQTFWSLKSYDIYLPSERYEVELARLTAKNDFLENKKPSSAMEAKTIDLEKRTTGIIIKKLTMEQKAQGLHVERVNAAIESAKESFLSDLNAQMVIDNFSHTFLSLCVYPRCIFSPEDAMFCSKFVLLLHSLDTPHFPTLNYFDKLMKAVPNAIFCVTENEAKNLALFLKDTWKTINSWRYDEDEYVKSAASKKSFKAAGKAIPFKDFCSIVKKWHNILSNVCFKCLRKSSEYIHTRAALIVLNSMVDVFPTRAENGLKLIKCVKRLMSDERQDIKKQAEGLVGQLNKNMNVGCWRNDDGSVYVDAKKEKADLAKLEAKKKAAEEMYKTMEKESGGKGISGRSAPGRASGGSSPVPGGVGGKFDSRGGGKFDSRGEGVQEKEEIGFQPPKPTGKTVKADKPKEKEKSPAPSLTPPSSKQKEKASSSKKIDAPSSKKDDAPSSKKDDAPSSKKDDAPSSKKDDAKNESKKDGTPASSRKRRGGAGAGAGAGEGDNEKKDSNNNSTSNGDDKETPKTDKQTEDDGESLQDQKAHNKRRRSRSRSMSAGDDEKEKSDPKRKKGNNGAKAPPPSSQANVAPPPPPPKRRAATPPPPPPPPPPPKKSNAAASSQRQQQNNARSLPPSSIRGNNNNNSINNNNNNNKNSNGSSSGSGNANSRSNNSNARGRRGGWR